MLSRELLARDGVECRFFFGTGWSSRLGASGAPAAPPAASPGNLLARLRGSVPRPPWLRKRILEWRFDRRQPAHDVYHEPNFFPYRSPAPTVTTFHDLSPLRFPQTHSRATRALWESQLPQALSRSRLILTVSKFVRDEVVSLLGVDAARVRAVPNGVSDSYRVLPEEQLRALLAPLGLEPGCYALAVGTLEPRKNLIGALDAWHALPDAVARAWPLVVAGRQGWLAAGIERRLGELERAGRARYVGYVEDTMLVGLYGGAKVFVYPSLYEGFGLPPLEAMACGTPVVVSNRSALPEVVGDAGIQVEPEDAQAIADTVRRVLEDRGEWERRRAAGLQRASGFSWARCADMTLEAYRAALG